MNARTLVSMLTLFVIALPMAAAEPLADRLPADTIVYLGYAGRTKAFDGSMTGQLLAEPATAKMVEAARNAILEKMPAQAGKVFSNAWDTLAVAQKHPMAIALTKFEMPDSQPDRSRGETQDASGKPQVEVCLLIDLGKDREAFDKSLQATLSALPSEVPILDVTQGDLKFKSFQIEKNVPLTFGYLGDTFFAAIGDGMPKKLSEIKADKSLASNQKFVDCMKAVGGEDEVLGYFLDAVAVRKIAQSARVMAAKVAYEFSNIYRKLSDSETKPAPFDPQPVIDGFNKTVVAMGLSKAAALAGTMRVVDKGMYSKTKLFTPAPHQGVLMPLAGGELTDADLASVPVDADFFVAGKASPKALYAELRRVIAAIDKQTDEKFTHELARAEDELGMSLEKDILAPIGDAWLVSSAASQGGMFTGTVLSISAADTTKLEETLTKIQDLVAKKMAPNPAPESAPYYTGRSGPEFTIESLKAGQDLIRYLQFHRQPVPLAPAWTIHKDKLCAALWPQVLQTSFDLSAGSLTTKGFGTEVNANRIAYQKVRSKVAAKPSCLVYVNTPQMVRQLYGVALFAWPAAVAGLGQEGFPARVDWLPPLSKVEKYIWPNVAAISSDKDGIVFESYGSLPIPIISVPTTIVPFVASFRSSTNVAVPNNTAKAMAAKADIATIQTQLSTFKMDCGKFPDSGNGLRDLMQKPENTENWQGPYFEKLPRDPWGHEYQYRCPGAHNTKAFDLWSVGPDGVDGTADDITNWSDRP